MTTLQAISLTLVQISYKANFTQHSLFEKWIVPHLIKKFPTVDYRVHDSTRSGKVPPYRWYLFTKLHEVIPENKSS
jgi:hypothetical protein